MKKSPRMTVKSPQSVSLLYDLLRQHFTQNGDSTNETSVCDQPGFAIKNWKPTKIWAAEKDLDPWIDQDGIFESAVEGYRKVSRFCFTRVES